MKAPERKAGLAEQVRLATIEAIVEVMKNSWDLPADCNHGELFAYAEILFDRIRTGEGSGTLDAYLADVQTTKLGLSASDAHRVIIGQALAIAGNV